MPAPTSEGGGWILEIKLSRSTQQLLVGITGVTRVTAPQGSYYPHRLLIGFLYCREKISMRYSSLITYHRWKHFERYVDRGIYGLCVFSVTSALKPKAIWKRVCFSRILLRVDSSVMKGLSSMLESASDWLVTTIKSCSRSTTARFYIWWLRFLEKYLSK